MLQRDSSSFVIHLLASKFARDSIEDWHIVLGESSFLMLMLKLFSGSTLIITRCCCDVVTLQLAYLIGLLDLS